MSTKEFDEYEFKDISKRVKITYRRDSDERLNPWEITNFVSRVTTCIYKIEILNTIALAINQGVEPKDIFILDRAYKLNRNYRNFSLIHLNTVALNHVYAVGRPVGMEPNQDLMEISCLFEILHEINKVLYQFGRKRITGYDRLDAYHVMRKKGFLKALQFIAETSGKKIREEEQIKADKRIRNACAKVYRKHGTYFSDQKWFESTQLKLDKKSMEDLSEVEQKIKNKYYKEFYDYLLMLPRPVVGIYDEQKNTFQILCGDHFDSSLDKHTKIDLKSVTQNSPIMAEIEAGCQILALKKDEKRKEEIHELEKQKLELEIANLETEKEIKEQEKTKNDLDIINKTLELKTRLDSMAETEENLGIKSIASSYAKDQLRSIYGKVQNGYKEVLKTNKFKEESETIIDMRV